MPLDHYILGGEDGHQAIPVSDIMEWGRMFERGERRIVARTTVRQPNRLMWALGLRPDYWVSTVFLGLNHNFGDGPPHIFETMVFRRWPSWKRWLSDPGGRSMQTSPPPLWLRPLFRANKALETTLWIPVFRSWSELSELDCERCSTWEEAEAQHQKVVAKWEQICQSGVVAN